MTTQTNILIIGGGVVGLTLANLLAENDISITLIDHQPPPTTGLIQPYDARVSAINFASQAIFQSIDVWSAMRQLRISAYNTMRVWDAGSPANIAFNAADLTQSHLGHIIEHGVMRQTLWQRLTQFPHVQLHHNTKPLALIEHPDYLTIALSDNTTISTSLLVGADGAKSWVADQSALSSEKISSHESAIVATLRTEYPHQQTAFQRFLSTGPIALLPLADPHLVSLVWSTTMTDAKELLTLSDIAFNTAVTQAIEHTLGNLHLCDQRVVFPLQRHHAVHYIKPHLALIGDAAHSILPLAGQGVNLGLLDAACLAQVIKNALKARRDIGALHTLRRYERWRKGENSAMLYAMEGFHQLFANSAEITRHLRHIGFTATQHLPGLKKYFMQRAAGLRGDLPASAIF